MKKKESPRLESMERVLKQAEFYGEELPLPNDESYYDDLHDKIMASIEKTEIKPVPHFQKKKDLLKRHWRFFTVMTMMLSITVLSFSLARGFSAELFQNSHAIKSAQNEDQILDIVSSSPDMLAKTILSYKTEQDVLAESELFMDENLTKEVFDSL